MCAEKNEEETLFIEERKWKNTVWRSRRTAEEEKRNNSQSKMNDRERWAELSRHLFLMEKENANVRFIFSSSSSYSLFSLWSSLALPSLSLATKLAESFAVAFSHFIFIYSHCFRGTKSHFFLCLHDRTSYSFLTRIQPKKKFAHSHTVIESSKPTHV